MINAEGTAAIVTFLFTSYVTYTFFIFAIHEDHPNLPMADWFTGNIKVLVEKYHTTANPGLKFLYIQWPILFGSKLFCLLFMAYESQYYKIFTNRFYFMWSLSMFGTFCWTFSFEKEYPKLSFASVVITIVCSIDLIYVTCVRSLAKTGDGQGYKTIPASRYWYYKNFIASTVGIASTWAFVAMIATNADFLSYTSSPGLPKALPGWLNLYDGTTVAFTTNLLAQLVWAYYDIITHPAYGDCIYTLYSHGSFCMFGLFFSHYDSQTGLDTHTGISLVSALLYLFLLIFRDQLKLLVHGKKFSGMKKE